MKNCPYCNEPISDDALKCQFCRQWLVDISKSKKKKNIFPLLIGALIIICLYHSLVVKAVRIEEVRQCSNLNGQAQEFEKCKQQITYWNTFLDFKKVSAALN